VQQDNTATEFWPVLDLWGIPNFGYGTSGFPGHSPEEFRCSLLFAYWMGATRVIVENVYIEKFGIVDTEGG